MGTIVRIGDYEVRASGNDFVILHRHVSTVLSIANRTKTLLEAIDYAIALNKLKPAILSAVGAD